MAHTVSAYDDDLKSIARMVTEIGGLAERAVGDSVTALTRLDTDLARRVIAGDRAKGLGGLFATLDGASDGTVAVAETRLEGLTDHCVLPASHSGLVLSAEVAAHTARFLREGRFAG